jgi:3-deoxy-7-phosphoheptulonate synthase
VLIVMKQGATPADVQGVMDAVAARGYKGHPIPGGQRTAVGVTGNQGADDAPAFEGLPGVLEVIPVSHGYKLVSREVKSEPTVVEIGGVLVGGPELVVTAGPCAVESMEQTLIVARRVKAAGAHLLRGGAY